MTAFTFSAEQIRSAPPEVRRWIANEIAHALAGIAGPQSGMPRPEMLRPEQAPQPMALAACTLPQALQVFELIGGDPVAARLFFELGRDSTVPSGMPGLHVLRTADLMRHAGLAGDDALIAGLTAIDRAFRQVTGEAAGNLFGFVDAAHLYVHEMTQASIRRVWEELVQARAAAERQQADAAPPPIQGFIPPHLGPSEDVAAHAPPAPNGDYRL
ncbi:MAG: hypothetical protein ACM3JG_20110 [Thiohalocapsa sp.]